MANKPLDSSLLDRAIVFAVQAHAGTERRGKGFPYIVHPMEAVEIVATMTSDQELLAAAALHDTVEDTDVTVEQIRAEFGDRVASIVDSESDKPIEGLGERDSWMARKQAAIDRLAAAPYDAKVVAMGDKLSNMRAIARDYAVQGDKLWQLFHAPQPSCHEWHYRGLANSLRDLADTFAFKEFVSLINQVWPLSSHYTIEPIDLNDYEQSGESVTAISYNHKDGNMMIKLYADYIPKNVPARELELAGLVKGMGIVTPAPGRVVTDGKRIGAEFERIVHKQSFARAISNHPEDLESYARRFARLCKQLHSIPCDMTRFENVKDHYDRTIKANPSLSEAEKDRALELVYSTPSASTCLHGDMHIGNVITTGAVDYWIDLGDFRFGDPIFDLGMFYLSCMGTSPEMAYNFWHLTKPQMAEVWKFFVDEYFPGEDLASVNARVAPYSALNLIFFGGRDKMTPEMLDQVHHLLFP